ncbi:MAG: hypothetical protein IBX63_07100 [Coriobacteriia bacterium]|nr:hypothetical protein [Coriobacteriia bacterium]
MSPVKNIVIALGIALTLSAGSSAAVQGSAEVPPIVIAREAEAVTRAVRLWIKRPVPGLLPAVAPVGHGVACTMQEHRSMA